MGVRGWGGRWCVRMGTGVLEDGEGGSVLGWGQVCQRMGTRAVCHRMGKRVG